ncbi:MAG: DUF1722 domain-containing protein [Anaerolineales bacterium]
MRVWDVSPGYLNRGSLLGEHREIHAILSIVSNDKKGYAHHPETLRWRGHLGALGLRHNMVVSEMALRGYRHHSPVAIQDATYWPHVYVNPPAEQFRILEKKYENREPGRIPLPQNAQQLWAQHKYSVLARDVAHYQQIGRSLVRPASAPAFEELVHSLSEYLRKRPPQRGLINALQHMWGYVSEFAREEGLPIPQDPIALSEIVGCLALAHNVTYLLHSTALSDLQTWAMIIDDKEPQMIDTNGKETPCPSAL